MGKDKKYRIIVAGSRTFNDYLKLKYHLFKIFSRLNQAPVIVSGCARGADKLGEQFAEKYDLDIARFHADWNKHGKSAGYKRNEEMAKYADILIAFWDGKSKGTKHMIDLAKEHDLPTKVIKVQ